MVSVTTWLLTGITVGLLYLLFASGFNLMFGVLRVLNIAHASAFAAAAIAAAAVSNLPIPEPLMIPALLVAAAGTGMLVALATQVLAIEPLLRLRNAKVNIEFASFLTTLGIFFVVESVLIKLTIGEPVPFNSSILSLGTVDIFGDRFIVRYFVAGAAALVFIAFILMLLRTKVGRYMRATADNRLLANVAGINVSATQRNAVLIAGGLAGLAGLLIAYLYGQAVYTLAAPFLLKAFVICIVGGLGSMAGATVVALSLGIIEAATITYVGAAWQQITGFALLIIVLAIRHEGLFGKKVRAQT